VLPKGRGKPKMILMADSQCTTSEQVKIYVKDFPSVEDLIASIDFWRIYPTEFYDYPSMMIPEKRKPLVNADQLIGWEHERI
jgi:hypothetical protein